MLLSATDHAFESAYDSLGIAAPVCLYTIAKAAGIQWRVASVETASDVERRRIVVNAFQERLDQREDFAHELAHILLHAGSQGVLSEPFIELQERQAASLTLLILVPTHLLLSYLDHARPHTEESTISAIAQGFDVSVPFARRRYRKFRAQVDAARQQEELAMVLERMPQYGRDYDSRLTIGRTEYFYRNGGVVFRRRAVTE